MLVNRRHVTATAQETGTSVLRTKDIDSDAVKVVRKLLTAGHEAYLVGGCVRDLYVKRRPKDFDVATSATPEEIHKLFRNSRVIGRRFKLVHVYFGPKVIETSTFRTAPRQQEEGEDMLITHDNEWGSVEDDARRRDFTINALFFDIETGKVVDFVDGMDDLDAGVIRTVGVPEVRFREDPVRMIRAIKFAARLDFSFEPETWAALLEVTPDIVKCSRARVLEELYKLLRGGSSRKSFELMLETGLLGHIWPEYVELYDTHGGLHPRAEDDPDDLPSALLWRHLEALDGYVQQTGQIASNGVLQAVLYAPLLAGQMLESSRASLDAAIDKLMHKPSVSLGVARRDRELARQIVMAHRRMTEGGRRRRRSSLVQRQYFHDALVFLGIWVEARDKDGAALERWHTLAASEASRNDGGGDAGGGKRKRRRGGRRRRGKKGGGGGGNG